MPNRQPLITIAQYSMTTARGIILESLPFDSIEAALYAPDLSNRTQSIVIKNNKAGVSTLFTPDFGNPYGQLKQELKEIFSDEFNNA
jgi:hypothetical protein